MRQNTKGGVYNLIDWVIYELKYNHRISLYATV